MIEQIQAELNQLNLKQSLRQDQYNALLHKFFDLKEQVQKVKRKQNQKPNVSRLQIQIAYPLVIQYLDLEEICKMRLVSRQFSYLFKWNQAIITQKITTYLEKLKAFPVFQFDSSPDSIKLQFRIYKMNEYIQSTRLNGTDKKHTKQLMLEVGPQPFIEKPNQNHKLVHATYYRHMQAAINRQCETLKEDNEITGICQ
ncbi:hypothetical protein pb186bvf_011555 [Paramecium bursaria]